MKSDCRIFDLRYLEVIESAVIWDRGILAWLQNQIVGQDTGLLPLPDIGTRRDYIIFDVLILTQHYLRVLRICQQLPVRFSNQLFPT